MTGLLSGSSRQDGKARLLYVITKSEVGGAQTHLLELLRAFRHDFVIHLATGQEGFLAEEARKLGIPVTVLKNLANPIQPQRDVGGVIEVARLMARVRPDLVHAHSSKAGILARLAAHKYRTKSIFTVHGWAFADGVPWRQKLIAIPLESVAARFTSRIIVVSEADRRLAERYRVARPDQLRVIHNGVTDVPWRAKPTGGPPVRVMMVARFAPPKGHDELLRALALAKEAPWELWLVGDGPKRGMMEQMAERLGIRDRVTFWGEREDVAELLARCHLFVLVSNWEGLPLTILEAMRAGLPVVATDVGGVKEAVIDGETGFLVPRGNVDMLRDRLLQLIQSAELRGRMGQAGRSRYERYFTVERMIAETFRVYEEVLAENARAPKGTVKEDRASLGALPSTPRPCRGSADPGDRRGP